MSKKKYWQNNTDKTKPYRIDNLGHMNSMFCSNSEELEFVEILISQRLCGETEVFKLTSK